MTYPSPKRILYVITKSNFGGAQMYVYDLALAAKKAGHEVAVACGGQGELTVRLKSVGIPAFTIAGLERDINPLFELRSLLSLRSILKAYAPNVVHLNSSKAGVLGACICRLMRIQRIIFTAHGWPFFEDRSPLWKKVAWLGSQFTVCLSHKVICVSNNDLNNAHFYIGSEKLIRIYNGVTLPVLLPRSISETAFFSSELIAKHRESLRLLSIGELHPNKNHISILKALVSLKTSHPDKTFLLTIMGNGEEERNLRAYISENNLEENVVLAGFVNEPFEYLAGFDTLVFPSKKEGLPYTLLFAAQSGIPIIATRVGGIPEIIEHTSNSILLTSSSEGALKEALLTMHARHAGKTPVHQPKLMTAFSKPAMIEETFAAYF